MFSFREFIKAGFLGAVGKQPDYWIILNAGGYANQGVLTMEDLADIQAVIDAQYVADSGTDDSALYEG